MLLIELNLLWRPPKFLCGGTNFKHHTHAGPKGHLETCSSQTLPETPQVKGLGGFMCSIRWMSPFDGASRLQALYHHLFELLMSTFSPFCWPGLNDQNHTSHKCCSAHQRQVRLVKSIHPHSIHLFLYTERVWRSSLCPCRKAKNNFRRRETNWPSTSSAQHSQRPFLNTLFAHHRARLLLKHLFFKISFSVEMQLCKTCCKSSPNQLLHCALNHLILSILLPWNCWYFPKLPHHHFAGISSSTCTAYTLGTCLSIHLQAAKFQYDFSEAVVKIHSKESIPSAWQSVPKLGTNTLWFQPAAFILQD